MVRVAVRPLHAPLAPPLADALFDVVLAAPPSCLPGRVTPASASSSLLRVRRRLRDFVQLQHELPPSAAAAAAGGGGDIASAAAEFLSLVTSEHQNGGDGDDALARIRCGGGGVGHATQHLAWQLERSLQALLTHPPPLAQSARPLQRFLRGGDGGDKAMDAALQAADVVRERIPAGCTAEHAVKVAAAGEAQLVLWRFASEGDGVVFSARFTAEDGREESRGVEVDPYSADPYQDASAGGGVGDAWGAAESDDRALFRTPLSCTMAQYHTRYTFPAAAAADLGGVVVAMAGDDSAGDPADRRFVAGHFVARTAGELVLEWENTDTSSVVSKALEYQVAVVPLSQCTYEAGDDVGAAAAAAVDEGGEAPWLLALFTDSELVSVDDILRESDGDEDRYGDKGDDREDSSGGDLNGFGSGRSLGVSDRFAGSRGYSEDRDAERTIRRLEEEAAFHKQRAGEFEDSMVRAVAARVGMVDLLSTASAIH